MAKRATKPRKTGGLYASILSGGVGSRFWPLSRETSPKQLLNVAGSESLLKGTIKRLSPLIPSKNISIITSTKQGDIIRQHLGYAKGVASPGYVLEPVGRNTAPAIGLAAIRLMEEDPEAVMAVLPADHIVGKPATFRKALKAAAEVARLGHLVTFGIKPTSPETGFGYIKAKKRGFMKASGLSIRQIERFVEKPSLIKAKRYLTDGGYYWNSGIFVWKAESILKEIKEHLPKVYSALADIRDGKEIEKAYKKIEGISIDHGVLEKTRDAVLIEAPFPWSDMGSWSSIDDIYKADKNGNIIRGRVVDIESSNSIIMGSNRVVATIGLKDIILIDTPDATMVCPRARAQDVKQLVTMVKKKGWTEHEIHQTVERPWGTYTVMEESDGYKVKKIQVKPGARLSLQSHKQRSEHWVVISGKALVQRGEETVSIRKNESTYIPRGVKHRLENPAKEMLEIIEVQNGDYVGEDDIQRYDDDYERVPS